jgi:predicted amidohydrolase
MKIAAVQHDIRWLDREANFERLAPMIERAAGDGARLVVLSEMFSTGFAMGEQWADRLPEPFDGPSSRFLAEMARRHGVHVAGSCPELPRDAGSDARPANTLVLASPDGALHRYDKIHPFTYGGEDRWFRAGGSTVTVEIEGLTVSMFVCYDLRFADHFWKLASTTDLFIVPANWPATRAAHWTTLLSARAIENQAFVIGVNRVGTGGSLEYAGGSRIIGPFGEVLADAGSNEAIVYAEVSHEAVLETREKFPFLRDR